MIPFRDPQYANASPSVSLERGNYRMRAPVIRPVPFNLNGKTVRVRSSPEHKMSRTLLLFLILLALACASSFGTAYYLFTTRWELQVISVPSTIANSNMQADASGFPKDATNPKVVEHISYLSYLPHSGFHNQRIAFENALLLAYLLRRTLLVPPIRLGHKPIRYIDYDTLSRYHELDAKHGLSHCPNVPSYISRPPECLEYFETSYIPWNWLVNLSAIEAHQPMIHRPDMTQSWIEANLDIPSSDILVFRDTSPYQFRFLDTVNGFSPSKNKYQEDIYLSDLVRSKTRLLQIGTLFGSSRLRLKNVENILHLSLIRQSMVFTNNDLVRAASSITDALNGHYLGAHLRSGDGKFKAQFENTVRYVWWNLLHQILGLPVTIICDIEKLVNEAPSRSCQPTDTTNSKTSECEPESRCSSSPPKMAMNISNTPSSRITININCHSPRHRKDGYAMLNTPLYISTDIENPRTHPQLSILRQTFPCIFFLEDFPKEIEPLDHLRSPIDDVSLGPFLRPFVDALVVSKAVKVVGTEGSTFSRFIETILWNNKAWWQSAICQLRWWRCLLLRSLHLYKPWADGSHSLSLVPLSHPSNSIIQCRALNLYLSLLPP